MSSRLESLKSGLQGVLDSFGTERYHLRIADTEVMNLGLSLLSSQESLELTTNVLDLSDAALAAQDKQQQEIVNLMSDLSSAIRAYEEVEAANTCGMSMGPCVELGALPYVEKINRFGLQGVATMLGIVGSIANEGTKVPFTDLGPVQVLGHWATWGQKGSNASAFTGVTTVSHVKHNSAGAPGTSVDKPIVEVGSSVKRVADVSTSKAMGIEITEYQTPQGSLYMVTVGGTQTMNPFVNPLNPQGLVSALTEAAGVATVTREMLDAAIRQKVPPGARLLLAGHSQGGTAVDNLAHTAEYARDYQVEGVVTFGAPRHEQSENLEVPVTAIVRGDDPIPNSTAAVPTNDHVMEVIEDPPAATIKGLGDFITAPHGMSGYVGTTERLHVDPSVTAVAATSTINGLLKGATVKNSEMITVAQTPKDKAERARERDDFLKRGK